MRRVDQRSYVTAIANTAFLLYLYFAPELNWAPPLLLLLHSGVAIVVIAFCRIPTGDLLLLYSMLLLLEGETIWAGVSLLDAAVVAN